VQQYVIFNFASNCLEFVWREVDRYDPELCKKIWGRKATCEEEFYMVQDYITGALWYSCSIAIYSILRFEKAMPDSLRPIGPFWKFWGAKLIVSMAGMQRLALFVLTKMGVVAEVFAWYAHSYLLCFETLLLAWLHFWAYPATGYFKSETPKARGAERYWDQLEGIGELDGEGVELTRDSNAELESSAIDAGVHRRTSPSGASKVVEDTRVYPQMVGRSAQLDDDGGEPSDEQPGTTAALAARKWSQGTASAGAAAVWAPT